MIEPREVIWHVLEKKHVHKQYIDVIKDKYDGLMASVRIIRGETNIFSNYDRFIFCFEPINVCFSYS